MGSEKKKSKNLALKHRNAYTNSSHALHCINVYSSKMSWKNNYVLTNIYQGSTFLDVTQSQNVSVVCVYTCILYVCIVCACAFECDNIAEVSHFQLLFQPPSPLELQVQLMTVVQEDCQKAFSSHHKNKGKRNSQKSQI